MTVAQREQLMYMADELDNIFSPLAQKYCAKDPRCYLCCQGCATWNAHFRFTGVLDKPCDERMIREFNESAGAQEAFTTLKDKYGWDPVRGFLGDAGCRLPRSERSCYCQAAVCTCFAEGLDASAKKRVDDLISVIKSIRKQGGLLW